MKENLLKEDRSAIHDFRAKLRQSSVAPQVEAYVQWRRALARARASGEPDPLPPAQAPISINLDLTTACNFRCTHCIDWDTLNSRQKYRDAELRESLRWMANNGLRSVILIGGGEPTLYPRFASFVGFLKELDLQVAIVTNGSRGAALVEAAAHMSEGDWIRFSLDSGSPQLFAEMHRPTDPRVSLDVICEWVPKIKANNPRVRVGFSYIIAWKGASRDDDAILENVHEIALAAERAKRYGFDYIAYKPILERRPDGSEVMDPTKAASDASVVRGRIRAELDAAKQLADERFAVHESVNLRAFEEDTWRDWTRQPRTCHMQALRQVLSPLGLYNCPAHRGVSKARISDANAYREDRIASGGGDLLRILDEFDASHECREVTCLYNDVNWWLEELVADPERDLGAEGGEERGDFFL